MHGRPLAVATGNCASFTRVAAASAQLAREHHDARFILPEPADGVDEATINLWLKKIGDEAEVGEPLVEVSTYKVDTEVSADVAGVLVEVLIDEGHNRSN